ncbi:MAG: 4-carboxy-4-hydroxy-2-oxoadipate aldolase/oxaloacetate decarboxylase [Dehalococcoidia bacterium]|nr:4-carboxy-4-hydroxy-2-oxoadipate aldolase/oxaloacetate decarboxylase [Dehalococcoidia bacterium]
MIDVAVIHFIDRVSSDIVEAYKNLTSATVYEASGRRGALSSRLKPIDTGMKLCGPAVTVKLRPGDNLMLHKAIYVAHTGDIIVADAEGFVEAGAWGEIMTVAAMARGLGGLVFNGAIRDTREIVALGFPSFCAGVSIKGTDKASIGLINHPLILDNVVIQPGDLVLGDADGVVIVSRKDAGEVLRRSREREQTESRAMERLRAGESTLDMYRLTQILQQRHLTEETGDSGPDKGKRQ